MTLHFSKVDNAPHLASQSLILLFFAKILGSLFLFSSPAWGTYPEFNEVQSQKNIMNVLKEFTKEPHPMGSSAQLSLAIFLRQILQNLGLSVDVHKFQAQVPNTSSFLFGGQEKQPTRFVTGINVMGTKAGADNCLVLFAAHYDTKYMKNIRFVGANDGGSATALLVELARAVALEKFTPGTLGACSVSFVFFDGEEAFFPGWEEGKRRLGFQDNLYGSRAFVQKYHKISQGKHFIQEKPVELVLVLDMVGHKKQSLLLSQESHPRYSDRLLQAARNVKIARSSLVLSDDHTPFMQLKIPFLHIIDWVNLQEWHTQKDTLDIVSSQALMNLEKSLLDFLRMKR